MTPTGPIRTRNPSGGNFGIDWERITRWEDEALQASGEYTVPYERILAHIVIESGGDPSAVQRNNSNGWSYGLMQVVPRWHGDLIRRLSSTNFHSESALGELLLGAPLLAIRCGTAILNNYRTQHGSWDKASSAFFLGNPDWRGQDTVNGNTGEGYRRSLNGLIEEYGEGETPTMPNVKFAGAGVAVPLDVPFRQVLIPVGQTNQRPGTRMTPDRFVQHETANTNPGTDAASHLRWLQRGAPDDRGRSQQLGFHLVVDDKECIQMVPLDEIAWHGGDSAGPCNMRGIASELCVNSDGDKAKARSNAEKVAAASMLAMNLTLLQQHNACTGKDCPAIMRREGYWPTFTANVRDILNGTTPPPPTNEWDWLPNWLTPEHLKLAFPLADPTGKVTRKYVEYANVWDVMPEFHERKQDGAKSVWLFDGLTILSDGGKVWLPGETT